MMACGPEACQASSALRHGKFLATATPQLQLMAGLTEGDEVDYFVTHLMANSESERTLVVNIGTSTKQSSGCLLSLYAMIELWPYDWCYG